MLKLKLQYFGHLMRRADSFEKTLMLGKIMGRRRRGRQRMPSYRQLNEWLAAMTANEHVKDRDEKKDQLSPQFEKGLEETAQIFIDSDL